MTPRHITLLSYACPWTVRWRKARLSVARVGTAASASVVPLLLFVMV
ncbi:MULTISPECIES: hypothetical protein [Streptomyces]|uniref:ABC transporter permease n=1 Tax=Streptomyces siderophoricus TaxID=2802281 RepID=A0ABS1MJI1_9ACTN|nr:hypothetical protein [Streptomyces sp. 9-7]MBL1087880.1 hypothetical protein [Streptomyces sp. 9-7]